MASRKLTRDWAYLAIVSVQLFGMLILDLVSLYPKALYLDPFSPLHFLVTIRKTYVNLTGDPFFASAHYADWFHGFLAVEGLVQLPLAAYLVWNLSSNRPSNGPTELAGLAFGCLTFMGSVACCSELWGMGPELVSDEHKAKLFYATYMPFVIIPGVMAIDMYQRLLPRVQTDIKIKKLQ